MDNKENGCSKFFTNRNCEYFPCHSGIDESEFNCLFCYCPLYLLGENCGGGFVITEKGVKDCTACTFPHRKSNCEAMQERIKKAVKNK